MNSLKKQAWIYSPLSDGFFIIAPAFLISLAVVLFPNFFVEGEVSPMLWLLLIVGVDVSHVYSTLYRTYFDKEEFAIHKKPLVWIPLLAYVGAVCLYAVGVKVFWTVMAYIAVYHFVRQQYGFFRIYSRKEQLAFSFEKWLDPTVIYLATIYPIIYWHTHPRVFNWFVDGDFFYLPYPIIASIVGWIYVGLLLFYAGKELYKFTQNNFFNLPKNLILLGTAISWSLGIVLYNSDLAFTATNVIAHGIPYMALIWMYGKKKNKSTGIGFIYEFVSIPIFVAIIFIFALLEEGLWDTWVWGDHPQLFGWLHGLPELSATALIFVVPLLILPQLTHYIIDGFIWRMRGKKKVKVLIG